MLGTLFLLLASASPVQAVQEELRAYPWRYTPSAASATASPASAPTPTAPSPTSVAPAGAWSVQVASLSSEEAALKRKQELESQLGKGSITLTSSAGAWKLRYGNFPDKKAAQKAKDELKKKDIDGFPIEP